MEEKYYFILVKRGRDILNLDVDILRIVNQPFFPFDFLFTLIIYSVYFYFFFLVYFFVKKKKRKKLVHLIITSIIGLAFVFFLKYLIARPRPYEIYPDIEAYLHKKDPSFPSAHAFLSFLIFSFLPKNLKLKLFSSIILLVLIPFGLLYTGIHFPSDVLIGAIIGLLIPKLISEKFVGKLI